MLLRFIKKPPYKRVPSISYVDRRTNVICKERIPAEQWLKWLYHDPFGNLALEAVIKRKTVSRFYGRYMKTPSSTLKIRSFINLFEVDTGEFQKGLEEFTSFNDFFIRKLKKDARRIDQDPFSIISPADGKLLAFEKLHKDLHFIVKGDNFSLPEFLNNNKLAGEYLDGSMLLFRLTPADYHRFHFPIAGTPGNPHVIRGKYYSVSPISIRKKARTYYQNKREYTIIKSDLYGDVIMAEIGATLVGSIKQTFTPGRYYKKGEEKGYFEYGGSSVILLFKNRSIIIDDDLLFNTERTFETRVYFGERVAVKSNR